MTGALGAIVVFACVLVLSGMALAFLPPIFRTPVNLGIFWTNNIGGVVLGLLAAATSFGATVRAARAKALKRRGDTAPERSSRIAPVPWPPVSGPTPFSVYPNSLFIQPRSA